MFKNGDFLHNIPGGTKRCLNFQTLILESGADKLKIPGGGNNLGAREARAIFAPPWAIFAPPLKASQGGAISI